VVSRNTGITWRAAVKLPRQDALRDARSEQDATARQQLLDNTPRARLADRGITRDGASSLARARIQPRPGGESLLGGNPVLNLGSRTGMSARALRRTAPNCGGIDRNANASCHLAPVSLRRNTRRCRAAADAPKADALATRTPGASARRPDSGLRADSAADTRQRVVAGFTRAGAGRSRASR